MLWIGILVGAAAYAAFVFVAQCTFRIDQGYLGALTSFGAAIKEGDALRTYQPGLHTKWPWQQVHRVAMMEQNLELSGEEGGRTAMTEDGTILRFDSILRFHPVESELDQFLFDLKSPHEHITGLFTCLLRNEIADFRPNIAEDSSEVEKHDAATGGSYALIRRQRRMLNERIEAFCRTQIGERYGVRFSAVDLTDILPPDELANALNAVISAQTEAESLYALAEAEAQQRVVAAERGVAIARAKARATELEIQTLGTFLATLQEQGTLADYVARRRAEVVSQSRTLYLRSSS